MPPPPAQLIRSLLDKGRDADLTVVRIWAHTVDAQYAMQTSPGQYNEAIFRGLDYVLAEARLRGIRVGDAGRNTVRFGSLLRAGFTEIWWLVHSAWLRHG